MDTEDSPVVSRAHQAPSSISTFQCPLTISLPVDYSENASHPCPDSYSYNKIQFDRQMKGLRLSTNTTSCQTQQMATANRQNELHA